MDGTTLLGVVFFIVVLLFTEMTVLFFACNRLGYAPRDVVCILFCATHKSLTLGPCISPSPPPTQSPIGFTLRCCC